MTELGKILDPVTDKLKQLVLILSLVWHFPSIWRLLTIFSEKGIYAVCKNKRVKKKCEVKMVQNSVVR